MGEGGQGRFTALGTSLKGVADGLAALRAIKGVGANLEALTGKLGPFGTEIYNFATNAGDIDKIKTLAGAILDLAQGLKTLAAVNARNWRRYYRLRRAWTLRESPQ